MTRRLRFRVVSVATGVVLATVVGACSGDSTSAGVEVSGAVRLGLLAPLSGVGAEVGRDAQRGAELAAEVINTAEGAAGFEAVDVWGPAGAAQLSIVTTDTESDARRAVDETDRLITQHGVVGVVGAFDAVATLDASQRAERLRTPFVSGNVPLSALTERGLNWFFRSGPDVRSFGSAFVALLQGAEQPGRERTRIALLYGNHPAGHDLRATFDDLAEETDYDIVANVTYEPGDADLTAEVGAVRESAPDVVLLGALPGSGQALAAALAGLGYAPPGIVVYGSATEATPLAALPGLDGRVSRQVAWSVFTAQANPRAADILDRYQRIYGTPMTAAAASSFTSVTVLARAIGEAGSIDPERVRSALVALDIPGAQTIMPWEGVRFDSTHQNSLAGTLVEQAVGGQFGVVYPRDLAVATFNWPPLTSVRDGGG